MSELAQAYFKWLEGSASYEWARDRVEEIFDEDVDKAWAVTLELINAAPSKKSLSYVASGQLETLVCRCGEYLMDRIKDEARKNSKLLFAMTCIYIDEKTPVCKEYLSFVLDELEIRTEADVNRLVDLPDE
jgi:hypothetical protein